MFLNLIEKYNAIWTNPENPNAILIPFAAIVLFALIATTLLTTAGKERYSRYLSITVFCGTSLLSLLLMNSVTNHVKSGGNPYNAQYIYLAYTALYILATIVLYGLHIRTARYFSNLFFWVVGGMILTALLNGALFIKLVILNIYYEHAWFHSVHATLVNLVNLILIVPFLFDAVRKLTQRNKRH